MGTVKGEHLFPLNQPVVRVRPEKDVLLIRLKALHKAVDTYLEQREFDGKGSTEALNSMIFEQLQTQAVLEGLK